MASEVLGRRDAAPTTPNKSQQSRDGVAMQAFSTCSAEGAKRKHQAVNWSPLCGNVTQFCL